MRNPTLLHGVGHRLGAEGMPHRMPVHRPQDRAFIHTQIIHGLDDDRQHARDQAIDAVGRIALLALLRW
jgi:hypothetical protein